MKKFLPPLLTLLVISMTFGASNAIAGTTFGKFNIGAGDASDSANDFECDTYVAPESGTVTSFSQYHNSTGSTATQWKGILLDYATKIIVPDGISTASAVGVNNWATTTFAVAPAVIAGRTYGLCYVYNGTQFWKYDNDAGSTNIFQDSLSSYPNSFASPSSPAGQLINVGNFISSLYATYTTGTLKTVEQEGYRFRNDNGSESSATALAAQDTAITQPTLTTTRLRAIVNATGDLSSAPYQLEYKKSTDPYWTKATTTDNEFVAPTFVSQGSFGNGTGDFTAAIPSGYRDGDLLVAFINSANQAITTPTGWTQISNSPQSTGSAGLAGGVRLGVYYKIVSLIDDTFFNDRVFTVIDTGSYTAGRVMLFRGVSTTTPIDVSAGSVNSSATTAISTPAVTTSFPNELVVNGIGLDKDLDDGDTLSGEANANLTTLTEQNDDTTSAGVGGGIAVYTGVKVTAGSTGNTTATGDTSTTHAYITFALRPIEQRILIKSSTNISSGGTDATTALLTAPSGKTSGADFQAGKISDDTNPLPAIDLASGKYTELEWSLVATTSAATNDIYQFRVTNNGLPFETYSVTPQWTIGAAVTASVSSPRLVLKLGKVLLVKGKLIIR